MLDVVDTFFTLHRKSAPKKRKMHTHLTCAIVSSLHFLSHNIPPVNNIFSPQDIKATARIIDRGKLASSDRFNIIYVYSSRLPVYQVVMVKYLEQNTLI